MMYLLSSLFLAPLLTCQDSSSEPEKTATYIVPLKNTQAACCAAAVEKALKELFGPNVSVKNNLAEIKVPLDMKVPLSRIQKALQRANEGMGKQMNLTYSVDEERLKLGGARVIFEGTRSEIEKAVPGASVQERDNGRAAVTIERKSNVTLAELRKAVKIVDVELARVGATTGHPHSDDQTGGCKKPCCEPSKEEKKKGCCDK